MEKALAVFMCMALLDVVWARYTNAVSRLMPMPASVWATAITILNGAGVILYVADWWLLLPAAMGAFAGTYIGVHWSKRCS